MTRFRLGLCSITLARHDIRQVVEAARACNVAGIEWSARDHVAPGDLRAAAMARRHCGEAGLAIASYASYYQAAVDDAQAIPPLVDTAPALGAPLARVWAGRIGLPIGHPEQADVATAAEALVELDALVAPHGIAVSLEHHRLTLTDSAAETLALLERCLANGCRVYTHWQPRPGLSVERAEADLALLGSRLSHLHVFEWDAELQRWPLQHGKLRWARQLAAASRVRSDWPGPAFACLEFVRGDDSEQLRHDALVLRGLLDANCEEVSDPTVLDRAGRWPFVPALKCRPT